MGLDGVELILAIEEEFGIEIPDEDAANIVTVGGLYDYVVKKAQTKQGAKCLTAHCFYRLRRALHAELGHERKALKPDTPLEGLFPLKERRAQWGKLHSTFDLVLPDLRKPSWVHVASMLVLGAGILSIFAYQEKAHIVLPVCIVLAMAIGISTERLRNQFPSGVATLGALASRVFQLNSKALAAERGGISASEAQEKVKALIVYQLGVKPEDVVPEAEFVKDLGMG